MQFKAVKAGMIALLLSSGAQAEWALDGAASSFYYVTSKAAAVSEVNSFGGLSGTIADDGTATLAIDLATVNTAVEVRDQRMRDIVFQVLQFPVATVEIKLIDAELPDGMKSGELYSLGHTATVTLHGVSAEVDAALRVVKLDADSLMIQPARPLVVGAAAFGLAEAVEELRVIANLPSINPQVVVDFTLVYNKQ